MIDARLPSRRWPLALAFVLGACPGDDGVLTTTGMIDSGTSTTGGAESTSTGPGTSSGAVDSSSGGSSSGGSTGGSTEDSGTTGPGLVDEGCPECIVLVDGLEGGRGLALDETDVYFTDQDGGVVARVPKGGGEIYEIASNQMQPYGIGVTPDHVFWTTFVEMGSVMRAVQPDGPPIPMSADEFPRQVELHDGYIYWTTFDDALGRVRRLPVDAFGTPPQTLVALDGGVADLAVAGNYVYFTAHETAMPGLAPDGNVFAAPIDATTDPADLVALALSQAEPWGIAFHTGTVFWINGVGDPPNHPKRVLSVPADGSEIETYLAIDQTNPWGITADAYFVYWTDYTEVKAIPRAGGETMLLAEMQYVARSILTDDDNVYWITQNRVLQRPKPTP